MLSTKQRLKLEFICDRVAKSADVGIEDMIFAQKLAKANSSAGEMLRKARRAAANPDMQPGDFDDFLNQLDLGDPNPNNQRKEFKSADDIADFFSQEKTDDWRQRD